VDNILSLVMAIVGLVPAVILLYLRLKMRRKPNDQAEGVDRPSAAFTALLRELYDSENRLNVNNHARFISHVDIEPDRIYVRVNAQEIVIQCSAVSDKPEQTTDPGVARVYTHLLNYLSPETQQELKDYLDDGIEERDREGKALKPYIISETLSLGLSIGKLKLFELRKNFRRKVS
jgi:hypothetical protein